MEVPWTTALVVAPLAAAAVTYAVGRWRGDGSAERAALLVSLAPLALSLYVWLAKFEADGNALLDASNVALGEVAPWFDLAGIEARYLVGLDGVSMPLVVLSAFLTTVAIASAPRAITRARKEFYALVLGLEAGLIGVFVALDFMLFFVFWEAVLLPMYFLIAFWGSERSRYAAMKFLVYTNVASLALFVAAVALYFNSGVTSFSMIELTHAVHSGWLDGYFGVSGEHLALAAFAVTFVGFAVKVPVVPFHTWLPDAHVEAPTPVSVLLAGVLLKMGGYGLLRFNFTVLAESAVALALPVAALAVVSVVYGALLAMAQTDLKRIVAYSSISSMGYVTLGLVAYTEFALGGATFQMISHGLISGLMFMVVGAVYAETGLRDVRELSGLWRSMPVLTGVTLVAAFAYMGLPGTSGFAAEVLVFLGSMASEVVPYAPLVTALAMFGVVLVAGYLLFALQRVFYGELRLGSTAAADGGRPRVADVSFRQAAPLLVVLAAILLLGVQPDVVYDAIGSSTADVVDVVAGGEFG